MEKAFQNKILSFTTKLQNEIKGRVDNGVGDMFIYNFLKKHHADEIGSLAKSTLIAFIKHYKKSKGECPASETSLAEASKELAEIEQEQERLESTAVTDKSGYLEALKFKVNARLAWLSRLDVVDGRLNPQKEQIRIKYITLGKELTMEQAKLGGEVDSGTDIVVNLLQARMPIFHRAVQATVKEVCPDKMIEFQEVFKKKFAEKQVEFLGEVAEETRDIRKVN